MKINYSDATWSNSGSCPRTVVLATGVQTRTSPTKEKRAHLLPVSLEALYITIEMDFYTDHRLPKCYLNFVIEDPEGRLLVHSRTDLFDMWPGFDPGLHRVRVELPRSAMDYSYDSREGLI
jgi:hypothetical protein